MNGIIEPLPGLLDDPQFAITDLPALTDFHIAPLRDPAPLKHTNVPSPLEPVTANAIDPGRTGRHSPSRDGLRNTKRLPRITPSDVLLARESKKPHLAISELLEDADGSDNLPQQLPSFISLSVVEKSPVQVPNRLGQGPAQKRPRLDQDAEHTSHDLGRQLPRPAQKEVRLSRPAPLLPAMVTGLHEPPPSAALLPSMDTDKRPEAIRSISSKIQVRDILQDVGSRSPSPGFQTSHGPSSHGMQSAPAQPDVTSGRPPLNEQCFFLEPEPEFDISSNLAKDLKARRMRRKWTPVETQHLLAGVRKYGVGKWKQILEDASFTFTERSSVDLKDRYRVCSKADSLTAATAISVVLPVQLTSTPDTAAKVISRRSPPRLQQPSLQSSQSKQRRKRRAWTAAEDECLIKGVTRHGFQWTAIHDDPELGLNHRRATDLRDRIRNKFPEGYKHAESAPLRSEVKKAEKQKLRSDCTDMNPALNENMHDPEREKESLERQGDKSKEYEREREKERAGVTLPSLTLDDDDMDWDNRLPPLLPWDDIG